MAIYESTGKLTGTIESNNVSLAQEYLTSDNMTEFVDDSIRDAFELVEWRLGHDGNSYTVRATTNRELTDDELRVLAEWTSGQNSDGLGEGFEQQDFAWVGETYNSWGDSREDGEMCSFDWQTNDSKFTRVA